MSMKLNLSGNKASTANTGPEGMVELARGNVLVYRTPSGTRQGRFHLTVLEETEGAYPVCSCEGYQFRGKCKHADYAHKTFWDEVNERKAERKQVQEAVEARQKAMIETLGAMGNTIYPLATEQAEHPQRSVVND